MNSFATARSYSPILHLKPFFFLFKANNQLHVKVEERTAMEIKATYIRV